MAVKQAQSNWITPVGLVLALAAYVASSSWAVIFIGVVTIAAIWISRGTFSRNNTRRRKGQFLSWYNSATSRKKFAAGLFGGIILACILGLVIFEDNSGPSDLMVFAAFGLILILALTVATTKVKPNSQVPAIGQQIVKTSRKKPGGRMREGQQTKWYYQPGWALLIGFMTLLAAYGIGSRSLDIGSWQQYFMTLGLLIIGVNWLAHVVKGAIRHYAA